MPILTLLAFGIIFLLWQLWQHEAWQPHQVWADLSIKVHKKTFSLFSIWKKLGSWPWYSTPGFVVKFLTILDAKKLLEQTRLPFYEEDFYGFKQWLWTTGSLIFLCWLWFGTLNIKNGFILVGVIILTVLLPDLCLKAHLATQQRKMAEQVPYFLDLLSLTLQGGGNLEQGIVATTQNYQSELSDAVAYKLRELEWGRPLDKLFSELGEEIEDEDWQHFLSSLMRAKKLGVSLGDTLAIQSELMRTRRRQKAEELSRTAAVKISVPLVLFIFPALLIIYIGPGILQLMERT